MVMGSLTALVAFPEPSPGIALRWIQELRRLPLNDSMKSLGLKQPNERQVQKAQEDGRRVVGSSFGFGFGAI
jgi:hypothetical protein